MPGTSPGTSRIEPKAVDVAIASFQAADRRDRQNKYQDYRAPAEGLRLQFFWGLGSLAEHGEPGASASRVADRAQGGAVR